MGDNTTIVYSGQIYDEDGRMSFFENIDDEAWLRVNGQQVLDDSGWNTPTSGQVDFGRGGWFDFELRLGNGTGGAGPVGWGSPLGFGWDPSGNASSTRARDYTHPRNANAQTANVFRVATLDDPASIDTKNLGTYTITYTATDISGNQSSATRTVIVTDQPDNNPPVITLNGEENSQAEAAEPYVDLGATAVDDRDGDVTAKLSIANAVNPYELGTYEVTFSVTDAAGNEGVAKRIVEVKDTKGPVITINGDDVVLVERHGEYTEQGATGVDAFDGDLTEKILVGGDTVDTSKYGVYRVTYYLLDNTGNNADPVTRLVVIRDPYFAPAAYWSMNESSGATAKDSSENGHDGTLSAAEPDAKWISGQAGNGLTFDGQSDYVSLGDSTALAPETFSFSFWLKPTESLAGKESTIYWAKPNGRWTADGFIIRIDDRNGVQKAVNLVVDGTTQYTVVSEVDNFYESEKWTHVVVLFDSSNSVCRIFRNGEEQTVSGSGGKITAGSDPKYIGFNSPNYETSFLGAELDEVSLFPLTLTTEQVSWLAQGKDPRAVSDLTKPILTLAGEETITVEKGDLYVEAGFSAIDEYDGDITDNVTVEGTVDHLATGVYVLKYNVSDKADNAADERIRTVNVVDTTKPVLTLKGDAEITLEVHSTYEDAGATAIDKPSVDISDEITVTNPLDVSTPGEYTITYKVFDPAGNEAEITRKVTIVDTTAPVITLKGEAEVTHEGGSEYVDAGVTASDNLDGDITDQVTVVNPVDVTKLGEYTLTYNLTDDTGNQAAEVTRKVTVVDTTGPVITVTGDAEVTVEAGDTYEDAGATVADNIDSGLEATSVSTVDTTKPGEYAVTYNVADSNGNDAVQVSRKVTVVDTTAPVITLSGEAEINVEAAGTYSDAGATSTDIVDGDLTETIVTNNPVDTSKPGEYTVTYESTDAAGNKATLTRKVNVGDSAAPVITITGEVEVTHEGGSTYIDLGATANDALDGDLTDSISVENPVDTSIPGVYSVTYSVKDSNDNESTATRKVTVVDTAPPALTLIGDAEVTHEAGANYEDAGATALDAVDGDLTGEIATVSAVDISKPGEYAVTYNVSDGNGNAATELSRKVTVVDTTAPIITLNGLARVTVDAGSTYNELGATATDIVDGDLADEIVIEGAVDATTAGEYEITYNVTDAAGNAADEVKRTVVVTSDADETIPVITLLGDAAVTHEAGSTYTDAGATASDDRDGILTGNLVIVNGVDIDNLGVYTVTFNISDVAGNKAIEMVRTVTVVDTTAPTITLVGDLELTLSVGTDYTDAGSTVTDNLDSDLEVLTTSNVDTAVTGEYEVNFNVTDASGNKATQVVRKVIVVDQSLPVITLNGEAEITHEGGAEYVDAGAELTDNYDTEIELVVDNPVDVKKPGEYTITFNATDAAGNKAVEVTRKVTVVDTSAPLIVLKGEAEVTHEGGTDYTDAGVEVTDNIDEALEASVVTTVDTTKTGEYSVTYNVTDSTGNVAAEVTRKVTVVDTTVPVITLKGEADVTIEVKSDYTDAGADVADTIDSEITDKLIVVNDVDNTKLGDYAVTYNATDASGNKATEVKRTVHVVDTTVPVLTLLGEAEVTIEVKTAFVDEGVEVADNYDSDVPILTNNPLDPTKPGEYTITYNAKDSSGNEAVPVTRKVTVVDTTAPLITLVGDAEVAHEAGSDYADAGATVSDNLDTDLEATVVNPVDKDKLGEYTVTYNVTDSNGNQATEVTRKVTVVDTTGPVITLKGESEVTIEVGSEYTDAGATATDIVDGDLSATLESDTDLDATTLGEYTVTYDVTDAQGNKATQVSRKIIVVDTTAPVMQLIGADLVTIGKDDEYLDLGAIASDNYDGDISASIEVENNVITRLPGTYTINYSVEDSSGNKAEITRTVKVNRGVIVVLGAGALANNMLKGFLETLDFTTQILNIRDRDGGPDKYEAELKSARLIVVSPNVQWTDFDDESNRVKWNSIETPISLSLPKSLLTTRGAGRVLTIPIFLTATSLWMSLET